jgi:hypothetical protein
MGGHCLAAMGRMTDRVVHCLSVSGEEAVVEFVL